MEADRKMFGEFIRGKRREKNISQIELAKLAGVGISTIQRIENGNKKCTNAIIRSVLVALNEPYADFMCRWIPCERRRPEMPTGVNGSSPGAFIACFADGTIKLVSGVITMKTSDGTAYYDMQDFDMTQHKPMSLVICGEECELVPERIVAWMPLMPPYVAEG